MSHLVIAEQVSPLEEHLRTVFQATGVIATVTTIGVALFLQWWLVRRRRPALSLTFSPRLEDEDLVPLEFRDRIELWLRVRVEVKQKKATAHNVEVLLLKVRRPSYINDAAVVPTRQLAWSDTPDERLAIPSGTWRRIDILKLASVRRLPRRPTLTPALKSYEDALYRPGRRIPRFYRARLRGTNHAPNAYFGERYQLEDDGEYQFTLAVTADEVESTLWRLSFVYKGAPATAASQLLRQISDIQLRRISRTT
jgi:hypothetical protein